jgi:glycosyltransferase involved in cell wall biosynthesis
MSDTMRILHFVPKDCFPVNTGAKLRNYYFARELATHARVTYLSFAESSHNAENHSINSKEETFAPLESFCEQVISVPHENSYSLSKIVRGLVGRFPLTVLNYTTDAMAETLKQTLAENDFDIVHVESLLLSAYLPIIRAAKSRPMVVCDWHNIDSEVMQRYSKHAPSLARKVYALTTARRLQVLEIKALTQFDGHFVVSGRDRKKLLEISPDSRIFVADNGVDCNFYSDEAIEQAYSLWLQKKAFPPNEQSTKNTARSTGEVERFRLLFVGSMDYHANVDAVEKFAKEVWQTIFAQNPQINFTIVGRNPSAKILALANIPGIEITGTVEDVRPFYREAFAAIVPLRIGGGSRLKILEAMAAGVPIISTRLGAEGIEVKDSDNIILAESNEDFTRAASELIKNKALNQNIVFNARSFVNQRYDWTAIGKTIFNSYKLLSNDILSSEKAPEEVTTEAFEVSA